MTSHGNLRGVLGLQPTRVQKSRVNLEIPNWNCYMNAANPGSFTLKPLTVKHSAYMAAYIAAWQDLLRDA